MIGRTAPAALLLALLLTTAGCTGLLPTSSDTQVGETTTDETTDETTGGADAETRATTTARTTTDGERATVAFVSAEGTTSETISAMISDSPEERYTGLSDTASLGPNEGMLFVYEDEGDRAYVMREMAFPIDIIFIRADGTISAIHHAPTPPEGTEGHELTRYEGTAKWVLEIPYNWTVRHDVSVNDRVAINGSIPGATTGAS